VADFSNTVSSKSSFSTGLYFWLLPTVPIVLFIAAEFESVQHEIVGSNLIGLQETVNTPADKVN